MKFSILMSVYYKDDPIYFEKCLLSLMQQDQKANQLILVEDGDIPQEIIQIIEKFRHTLNIESIKLPHNQGLAKALNCGLQHCKYEIVMRMDADDICENNRFKMQCEFMNKNKSFDVLGTAAFLMDENDDIICLKKISKDINFYKLKKTSHIIHPSVCYRRSSILNVGGYDESLIKSQDWDLWLRLASEGYKLGNLELPLFRLRVSKDLIKRRKNEQKYNRIILRKHLSFKECIFPFLRTYIIELSPLWILNFFVMRVHFAYKKTKNYQKNT